MLKSDELLIAKFANILHYIKGTGTAAGDPLELGAVARTISQTRKSDDKLYVGSVKSNVSDFFSLF